MSEPTIVLPFAPDAEVWHIGPSYSETYVPCPECAGTRHVTLVLGNGEQHKMPCQACSRGLERPAGRVYHRTAGHRPTKVRLEGLHEYRDGVATYLTDNKVCILHSAELFATEAECQALCDERNKAVEEALRSTELAVLTQHREHMAFSVTYWRRQRAETIRRLERIEELLGIAKAKAKEAKKP